jgi:hypothetical protein
VSETYLKVAKYLENQGDNATEYYEKSIVYASPESKIPKLNETRTKLEILSQQLAENSSLDETNRAITALRKLYTASSNPEDTVQIVT